MIEAIIILGNLIFIVALPQSAMIIQWVFDPVIHATYCSPWTQSNLEHESRAYHQHLVNHCLISLVATMLAFMASFPGAPRIVFFVIGCLGFVASLAYPIFKEKYFDPIVMKKPLNDLDWRERLFGAVLPMPIFALAVAHFLGG